MDNNDEFQAYVRRVSFDITLTGPQCFLLVAAYRKICVDYGHFVPVIRGLGRKGLIIHQHDMWLQDRGGGRMITTCTGAFSGDRPAYRLTKEGELTAQLVEAARLPEIEHILTMRRMPERV